MNLKTLPKSKTFAQHVQGVLSARFHLENGQPEYSVEDGTKDYSIELWLRSTQKIELVTFYLDRDTYYDPVRMAEKRPDGYYEEFSAFEDFVITAEVQVAGRIYSQEMWLSELLRAGHAQELDPA